jgi:hypothetical protein
MILAGKIVILKGFGANFLAMQVQPMPGSSSSAYDRSYVLFVGSDASGAYLVGAVSCDHSFHLEDIGRSQFWWGNL